MLSHRLVVASLNDKAVVLARENNMPGWAREAFIRSGDPDIRRRKTLTGFRTMNDSRNEKEQCEEDVDPKIWKKGEVSTDLAAREQEERKEYWI